jgi:tRNA(adenine34) deaminase
MASIDDERFMRAAIAEAVVAAATGDVPVGAVAVWRGEIVGQGRNEKEWRCDPTAHAEMAAIRQAAECLCSWRLTSVTLYCTMEPCPMCAGAMVQARLGRLVYAVDDAKAGAAGSVVDLLRMPYLNHRVEVCRGVLAREVESILKEFFSGLRAPARD